MTIAEAIEQAYAAMIYAQHVRMGIPEKTARHLADLAPRASGCYQCKPEDAVAAIARFLECVEPSEAAWILGRQPIMAFQDAGYGPKWNLGNHMDAAGYKGWATEAERQMVNITKGDCAVFVWRAMSRKLAEEVRG